MEHGRAVVGIRLAEEPEHARDRGRADARRHLEVAIGQVVDRVCLVRAVVRPEHLDDGEVVHGRAEGLGGHAVTVALGNRPQVHDGPQADRGQGGDVGVVESVQSVGTEHHPGTDATTVDGRQIADVTEVERVREHDERTVDEGGHEPESTVGSVRLPTGLAIMCLVVTACSSGSDKAADTSTRTVRHLRVEVLHTYPHDVSSFTEGLVMTPDGRLFESSGQYGSSDVREVDLESGHVLRRTRLDDNYFGEGLADTTTGDLVQLTWKEGAALVWKADDLTAAGRFSYSGEGWGLTRDGGQLLQSDGSDQLTRRDPTTFSALGRLRVTEDGAPVDQLNELEAVGSVVYANVWKTTDIVEIDPSSGHVTATVDASSLVPKGLHDREAVLNGIAHRPGSPPDQLFVTGKEWPVLYDVRLVPA